MLTRWDPFRELVRAQEEMNRALGDERVGFSGGRIGGLDTRVRRENYHCLELSYGTFYSRLLDAGVHLRGQDPGRVEAGSADGPPAEEAGGEAQEHRGEGELERASVRAVRLRRSRSVVS